MCIRPEIKVNVQQKRVGESDADDGDGISDAQQRGPGIVAEIEETVQSDDEVARVPPAHREGEQCEETLDVAQLAAMRDELKQHPERQQRADAVTDDLENLEGIKWGHDN